MMKTTIKLHQRDDVVTMQQKIKLGGKTFVTFKFRGSQYELDRPHAARFLEALKAFGKDCSDTCRQVRTILADALKKEAA